MRPSPSVATWQGGSARRWTDCHWLALLYQAQGKLEDAEPLFLQAREIYREVLGEKHLNYATTVQNLLSLYEDWLASAEQSGDEEAVARLRERRAGLLRENRELL